MRATNCLVRLAFIASMLLLILFVEDHAQTVRYNFLPGQDFSKYKTYKWVDVPDADYPAPAIDEQIRRSIDAQLSAKGLTKSEGDDTDLRVMYQLAINEEKQWKKYKSGGDEYWGWGGWGGWGGSSGSIRESILRTGTLNLDFYDVALKKQVWRGEATKTLRNPGDKETLRRNIDRAMARLLKDFPPLVLK